MAQSHPENEQNPLHSPKRAVETALPATNEVRCNMAAISRRQFGPFYDDLLLNAPSGHGAVLPYEHGLIVHVDGWAVLVDWARRRPVAGCPFTKEELPLLLAVLRKWPRYCPYEHLLALTRTESEQSPAQQIEFLRETKALQELLAPLREQLNGYQERLGLLGLRIGSAYHRGYILRPTPPRPKNLAGCFQSCIAAL